MVASSAQTRSNSSQSHLELIAQWTHRLLTWGFAAFITVVLYLGWQNRETLKDYINAGDGLGYILGIIGGSLMLLLMLYPLRKHLKFMHGWGPVRYWFKLHMLFGVIGPVLVIFHSNFSLGSTNSNLALFSMLLVAGSGLFGRYFYTRIHFGLYGHQATLKELRTDLQLTKGNLGSHFTLSKLSIRRIQKYEKFMLKNRFFLMHLVFIPLLFLRSQWSKYRIRSSVYSSLKHQAKEKNWDRQIFQDFKKLAKDDLHEYFFCLRKTSQLAMYSRLFSLWHIFHMPLFILLVITGIIHVVAVHMY